MFPKTMKDPEYPSKVGVRNDGRNLVLEWMKNKKVNGGFYKCCSIGFTLSVNECDFSSGCTMLHFSISKKGLNPSPPFQKLPVNLFVFMYCQQNVKYVWNTAEFDAVNPATTDFLMGKTNSPVSWTAGPHIQGKATKQVCLCRYSLQCSFHEM